MERRGTHEARNVGVAATMKAWLARIVGTVRTPRVERELDEELRSHLQMAIEDQVRAGVAPEEARRRAHLQLGGVEVTRMAYRDRVTFPLLDELRQDVRLAGRQLRRAPGFAATAIFMLAVGLCASITIYAFVDAALVRPLPYREPARLVALNETTPLGPQFHLSYLDYLDWKKANRVFSALDVFDVRALTLATSGGARQVDGVQVSASFFRTLGVTPVLGRDFREGEDVTSAPGTVMLSHAAWQTRFGGDPAILGRSLTIDNAPHTIVGILPREFHFAPAGAPELWIALHARCAEERGCHDLAGLARLKEGVSLEQASAEMTAIAARLAVQYPDSNRDRGAAVTPLVDRIVGSVRPSLLLLLGGAGLLLLITGVNVASLLLVRSESRRREFALRGALGASRARLLRQFITEGLVLVSAAVTLGLAAAHTAMHLLAGLMPATMLTGMPYLAGLGMNARVLTFAVALAVLMAGLFCLIPAISLIRVTRVSSSNMRGALTDGSRGAAGTLWRRLGAQLVVVELATAMVLLVSAGLLGQSFYRLMRVDIGVQPDRIAAIRVGIPRAIYTKPEQIVAMQRRVLACVKELPGVEAASLNVILPVGTGVGTSSIEVAGRPRPGARDNQITLRNVGPAYFSTVRARLLRGREFTEAEDATRPPVAIINASAARQFFPNEDPLGRRVQFEGEPETAMEVVGVVDDIKEGPLNASPRPAMYLPTYQDIASRAFVVVRTTGAPGAMLPVLRAAVQQISPDLATSNETVLSDRIQESPAAWLQRASAWIVSGFAGVALLLGIVGLYGVIAYSVSQRTREIGVRMALGAQRGGVCRLILKEAGWLAVMGIAIGLIASMAVAPLLGTLLFGVGASDAVTLASVALVLAVAALVASFVPARRAASVSPVEALRAS